MSEVGHVYWLASYPKSGNTWMRALLANYFDEGDRPADINRLGSGPIASSRTVFDEYVGIEASDLTQDEIERLRPLVYERISEQIAEADPADPLFLKVHDAFVRTVDAVPIMSKRATAGAVYLVRNPLDVAVSFSHHSAQSVADIVTHMADPDFAFVSEPSRLHRQMRQRLLTWSGHVTSWLDEPGLRVLCVRYEDLLADTRTVFSSVLQFAGVTPDPDRVATAVEFSRFDELQRQEADGGFGEKNPRSESFFRTGQAGSWRTELDAELVERVMSDHRSVMTRLGYLEP